MHKRLGYIIEAAEINAPGVVAECAKKISRGYTRLEPSIKEGGKHLAKWNLIINALVRKEEK
jgi:predicted transcriptional regulator of viral defense system